ncbi:MAG: hypothetical protein K6E83_08540 [Clostridium sp.]|nr:hypothetical protein [Clostridium sp.]
MPELTVKDRKEYADKAAAAYAEFKKRIEGDPVLTRPEKNERLESFLDAHVSIFDEYYAAAEAVRSPERGRRQRDLNGDERLSGKAEDMAEDIAALFASSGTGRYFMSHRGGRRMEDQAQHLDATAKRRLSGSNREDASASYISSARSNFRTQERRTSLDFSVRAPDPAVTAVQQAQVRIDQAQARVDRLQQQAASLQAEIDRARARVEEARTQVNQANARAEGALDAEDSWGESSIDYGDIAEEAKGRLTQAVEQLQALQDRTASRMASLQIEMAQARAELEQVRGNQPDEEDEADEADESTRELRMQGSEKRDGLNSSQIQGIRDVSAFLYRNTMHGTESTREERGAFIDAFMTRPPRQKLLTFYLIEKDKLHENVEIPEVVKVLGGGYIPNLEEFRPHIFGGAGFLRGRLLKGVFGRATGDSLDWSKLSDAMHSAEELMAQVSVLLGPQAAGPAPAMVAGVAAAGAALADPELAAALQRVADAGSVLLQNPNPPQAAADDFQAALDALIAYIDSQQKSGLAQAQKDIKWLAEKDKYLGFIKSSAGAIGSIMSGAKEETSEKNPAFGRLGKANTAFSIVSVPLGMVNTIVSFVTFAGSAAKFATSGAGGFERAKEFMHAFKDFSSSLNGIYGAVRGVAGLDKAKWVKFDAAVQAAGGAAIALGLMSFIQGAYHSSKASEQESSFRQFEVNLIGYRPKDNMTQQELEELDAQKQMLINIAASGRAAASRKSTMGNVQMVTATLQMIAGGLTVGGVTAIAGAAVSLTALVIGLGATIKEYRMKKAEKKDVIDRYIGMDQLYRNFKTEKQNGLDPEGFVKKYGKEKDIKDMLRKHAEAELGFPSDDKMHAYIMWQYASALYQGAFLKNDGSPLTAQEESDPQEHRKRKVYAELIRSYLLEVRYPPTQGDSPSPGREAIYKALMA